MNIELPGFLVAGPNDPDGDRQMKKHKKRIWDRGKPSLTKKNAKGHAAERYLSTVREHSPPFIDDEG